jgi:SAM-dependent methyltransferase
LMHLYWQARNMAGMLRPGKNPKSIMFGTCNICGKGTVFFHDDRFPTRSTNKCLFCGSTCRKRHVAKEILRIYDPSAGNIRASSKLRQFRVLNTGWKDTFTRYMAGSESYFYSEYFQDVPSGTRIESRGYCEDIQNLSFQDGFFDLVVTEDVLEHIRDYRKALAEVHRVLRQGGHHIFTVPCRLDAPTLVRVDTSSDVDKYLTKPEYHMGGPSGKIIAYRTFGVDILDDLERTGFNTSVLHSQSDDIKHGILNSQVFVSRKN